MDIHEIWGGWLTTLAGQRLQPPPFSLSPRTSRFHMKQCTYCGRENGDEATRCLECGTEFGAPDWPDAPPVNNRVRIPAFPGRLQVAVIASTVIVVLNFAAWIFRSLLFNIDLMGHLHLPLLGGFIAFAAGVCGTVCGILALFTVRGFPRLVAAMSVLVSLDAVVRCAGFAAWSLGLP